jgi:NDP-sugar pyrophosphorylase family protein
MSNLKVILPAAGKGTRLNLPYPKEILRLNNDEALIDHSFNFFRDYGRKDVEFVVIINEDKPELLSYLAKYKDRYNISFVYQNPNEREYTGAIKSASHLFGEHNLVLLPDTIMRLATGTDLYELVSNSLTETGFTFLYKKELDENVLRTKGALYVNDKGIITEYEDKPDSNLKKYNAFWCSFAFRKRVFNQCIGFMEKSTLRQKISIDEIKQTPIYNSRGIEVEDYIDLGTWEEIRRMLLNEENNNRL